MLKAVAEGAQTIRILTDDTNGELRVVTKIQMEKGNGDVLDINETAQQLGPRKCSQLLGYIEIDIPGLDQVLEKLGVTHTQLEETVYTFFLPIYGQKGCTTMNDARAHIYRSHKKPPPLKKRPPTDANLQLHVLRAHLQMLLWKAADQHDPPEEAQNIANFGWSIEGSAITTAVSTAPVAPQALLDAVSCSCTTECKACSGTRCSCNSAGLSCTDYCKYEGGDICCSPFTSKQMDIGDDEGESSVDDN